MQWHLTSQPGIEGDRLRAAEFLDGDCLVALKYRQVHGLLSLLVEFTQEGMCHAAIIQPVQYTQTHPQHLEP